MTFDMLCYVIYVYQSISKVFITFDMLCNSYDIYVYLSITKVFMTFDLLCYEIYVHLGISKVFMTFNMPCYDNCNLHGLKYNIVWKL